MFINEALINAFETDKGNASKDEKHAITHVIKKEILQNTENTCYRDIDACDVFIAADNMRGYIAIYVSGSIGEQILCSYNVMFKYGVLHYLVLPYKYDECNIDSCKYIDYFFQKAMEVSNVNQIPGVSIIAQMLFSKFIQKYAGILDRHEMMFRFMKNLIMKGINPYVSIKRYWDPKVTEVSEDEVYELRHDCGKRMPKRKFPITMHSINFITSDDGDCYECEDVFMRLLDLCMSYVSLYTDTGFTFESLAKEVSRIFMEDDRICTLLFASHYKMSSADERKEILGTCKEALADTSIDARISFDREKKFLVMQVTPLKSNEAAFESKVELTGNDTLDAYHLLNLNTFVKDWFNAENKNGVPTTMEEYQKYPMGNPQPIEIPECICNSFID